MSEIKTENTIRFILDNKIVTVDFSDSLKPTTTLLNYLRSLPNHKGVKEGCAEGDCGACTVVIAEAENGKLKYKAVNSCLIFLPMVHGKQVITVENLAEKKGDKLKLHPVQVALVESDGTQCGFCTPGVVMSLFGLYKNRLNPARIEVEEALAGNLCRCTGYQPILNAGLSLPDNNRDKFTAGEQDTLELLEGIRNNLGSISIETDGKSYFMPATIEEALKLTVKHPDALIISGATDVALKQTKKYEILNSIIDLSAVESLKGIAEDNGFYIIRAATTLEDVKQFFSSKVPVFSDMLKYFASRQIRNVATIGGNMATASPISDTIPLLFALEAWVTFTGEKGERTCNIENFITGYRETALQKGDIIKNIIIPAVEENCYIKFYKVSKRKDVDISSVSAGFSVKLQNDVVKEIILAFGGMAEMTKRAEKTEGFLRGEIWTKENVEHAMMILYKEFTPISDARAGGEYRRDVAANLLMKFFNETIVAK